MGDDIMRVQDGQVGGVREFERNKRDILTESYDGVRENIHVEIPRNPQVWHQLLLLGVMERVPELAFYNHIGDYSFIIEPFIQQLIEAEVEIHRQVAGWFRWKHVW